MGNLNEGDIGTLLPLQIAVNRCVRRFSQEPCSGLLRVESLLIAEMSWLRIELSEGPRVTHPPFIPPGFRSPTRTASQTVVYIGGSHFTARHFDRSVTWWKYDGQWRLGALYVDHGGEETDLLRNGDRRVAFCSGVAKRVYSI